MTTASMQARLDSLISEIETGVKYDLQPSDCSGNGYDIAYKSRDDESGVYPLSDGRMAYVTCSVKVGSKSWRDGIPAMYTLEVSDGSPVDEIAFRPTDKPYVLVRFVCKANGAWQWLRGSRGYFRAVHVDPRRGNAKGLQNAVGTICVIAETHDIDGGSKAPRKEAFESAVVSARRYAAKHNLSVFIGG